MKDSKEKEHRISNLKDMIDNIQEDDFLESDEFEEDSELINYLNEDTVNYDELVIDDEFIYRPSDEATNSINLEEGSIDEDFIIKAPSEKEIENENIDEFSDDAIGEISENLDGIVHAKIGRTPILGIVSTILGLILIVISAFIFQSRSDRVIDHVVSGETNFIFVIVLALGLVFFVYGIFKMFHISNPLKGMSDRIDSIDTDDEKTDDTAQKDQPEPTTIPKSEIPLDKDSYKIGEYEFEDLKNKLKKPTSSKKHDVQQTLDDIPPAKEKEESHKGLTPEEIEEMEYNKVVLESESIDEIFAEVEDIEDIPIISIDSKEKEE